jgi:hypothetical protein
MIVGAPPVAPVCKRLAGLARPGGTHEARRCDRWMMREQHMRSRVRRPCAVGCGCFHASLRARGVFVRSASGGQGPRL